MATSHALRSHASKTLMIHHQHRTFLFGSTKYTKYEKSGIAIEIGDNDFILDENFSPHYNPNKDVIIRNYSSAVTCKNVEHLCLPFNELTQKRLFYTNFSGILEYIPHKYRKSGLYKIGDRVWGIKAHYKQAVNASSFFGIKVKAKPYTHNNAWSDYIATDIRYICHLPLNIPLLYGGLFGTDLLMIFDGFGRCNWMRTKQKIANKKVLIIGSGRQSLLNILIPLLQICNVSEIVIISNHKRHNKLLAKFNVKSIIDRNNFAASKHKLNYDIIIDSLSIHHQEVQNNVSLIDPDAFNKTEYWVLRNPYNQILMDSQTKTQVAKGVFTWNKDIVRAGKKVGMNDVLVKPIRMTFGSGGLKAFTYWMYLFGKELEQKGNELSYPIIVDRLYKLTNIEHALQYCLDHDMEDEHYGLGEHIALSINKMDQNQVVENNPKMEEIHEWKPMQLLDIDTFDEKTNKVKVVANTLSDEN